MECIYICCEDDCEVSGNTKTKKEAVNFQVEFVDSQAFKTVQC